MVKDFRDRARASDRTGTARGAMAGLLRRLRADRAGNVLAIAAVCIPPVLILVGGGVDMSRAYMTQTSLQNACDAGVLAGRRAQAKSGLWGTAEQQKAQRMFSFNFHATSASANANTTSFTPVNSGGGVVSGTATTTIPTVMMQMFGHNLMTLRANCSAEFQISNIDVMMVLDTTGSMEDNPDGTNCYPCTTSKIEGLKTAIRSFYTTIAQSVPAGSTTRVRFAFTPYNGTVNIGTLVADGDFSTGYLTSTTPYQTKLASFNTPNYVGTPGAPKNTTETYSGDIPKSDCDDYGDNDYPSRGNNPATSGTAPAAVTTTTYGYKSWTKTGTSGKGKKAVDVGTCVRDVSTTITTNFTLSGYKFSGWRYTQASLDTSVLKTRTAVPVATSASVIAATVPTAGYYNLLELAAMAGTTGIATTNLTWNGCIEERSTVNAMIVPTSIAGGATDLDVQSAPSGDPTRWKPYMGALAFDRGQTATLDTSDNKGSQSEYCPPAARKFTVVDTTAPNTVPAWLETYLGTLYPRGGTYHDVGMIWGARLAHPGGIMSTNVNDGNLASISRHIIFMTDGEMAPNHSLYTAYGIEYLDTRVAPLSADLDWTVYQNYLRPYHNARFLAACRRATEAGYTVWVIGFGQAISTEMEACAPGRAKYASDTADLQSAFRDIASRIADLRLKS